MINDVPPGDLIIRTAAELKKLPEFTPPDWAQFAKTGHSRQRPPVNPDWWHVRAAAVLRKILLNGPVGVSKLSVQFGGRKNYGHAPEHFAPAATNHLRKILQQLEKAGFCKQGAVDSNKGRVITPKGISFLDKAAAEVAKELNITIPKKPAVTDLPAHVEEKKPTKKSAKATPGAKTPAKPRAPRKKAEAKPAEQKPADVKPAGAHPHAAHTPAKPEGA